MKKSAITNKMVCCSYIKPNHVTRDVFANQKIELTIKESLRKDTKECVTSSKLADRGITADRLANVYELNMDNVLANVIEPNEERDNSYLQDDITNLPKDVNIFETDY